jgi:hypothetical protein
MSGRQRALLVNSAYVAAMPPKLKNHTNLIWMKPTKQPTKSRNYSQPAYVYMSESWEWRSGTEILALRLYDLLGCSKCKYEHTSLDTAAHMIDVFALPPSDDLRMQVNLLSR